MYALMNATVSTNAYIWFYDCIVMVTCPFFLRLSERSPPARRLRRRPRGQVRHGSTAWSVCAANWTTGVT